MPMSLLKRITHIPNSISTFSKPFLPRTTIRAIVDTTWSKESVGSKIEPAIRDEKDPESTRSDDEKILKELENTKTVMWVLLALPICYTVLDILLDGGSWQGLSTKQKIKRGNGFVAMVFLIFYGIHARKLRMRLRRQSGSLC
ncbi:hypothetical protein F4781DRAFT_331096 [Annulohypoxylon bovei var. microspora]|nr:hypothetical protein F4781DRAFT_331096 [Annulohypoxylon bovei var. microspora]